MEAAGHMPMSPPVTLVGPTLLTTGVPPSIPKLQAVASGDGEPGCGGGQGAEVVNVHLKLDASVLPKVSAAPVVMVAVNEEVAASGVVGVKVAI